MENNLSVVMTEKEQYQTGKFAFIQISYISSSRKKGKIE
jgi:hypothetical protein